jgi:hypothetical protein
MTSMRRSLAIAWFTLDCMVKPLLASAQPTVTRPFWSCASAQGSSSPCHPVTSDNACYRSQWSLSLIRTALPIEYVQIGIQFSSSIRSYTPATRYARSKNLQRSKTPQYPPARKPVVRSPLLDDGVTKGLKSFEKELPSPVRQGIFQ